MADSDDNFDMDEFDPGSDLELDMDKDEWGLEMEDRNPQSSRKNYSDRKQTSNSNSSNVRHPTQKRSGLPNSTSKKSKTKSNKLIPEQSRSIRVNDRAKKTMKERAASRTRKDVEANNSSGVDRNGKHAKALRLISSEKDAVTAIRETFGTREDLNKDGTADEEALVAELEDITLDRPAVEFDYDEYGMGFEDPVSEDDARWDHDSVFSKESADEVPEEDQLKRCPSCKAGILPNILSELTALLKRYYTLCRTKGQYAT
ncbi:hypothetical protein JVU11DRAFT_10618 [Chiua virens]|nr:hypothetical protein JVU11DRAFT_10618 [Chiua virens]